MNFADTPEQLFRLQKAFAGHIRNPQGVPGPADVEDRRMAIYRELFFKNVRSLLAGNFPVLKRLYTEDEWTGLVRDFFSEHRAQTPLFPELPKEFLRYLQDVRGSRSDDPPYLLELAHYEWVELALSLDPRELDQVEAERQGDLLARVPVLSPLAWRLSYRFPVHRISPDYRPQTPPENVTQLLAYRNRADAVRFMQLNDVTALLLQRLAEGPPRTGGDLLAETAAAIGHPDPDAMIRHGLQLLHDFRDRDIVLGTRSPT